MKYVEPFVPVTLSLLEQFGFRDSVILSMVEFRTRRENRSAVDADGHLWWEVSESEMTKMFHTGLSTLRRAIADLESSGHLVVDREGTRLKRYRIPDYGQNEQTPYVQNEQNPMVEMNIDEVPSPYIEKKSNNTTADDMSSFDAWWELYPKKVDKHNAAKKFKLVPAGDLEHVMASTELLAAEWSERVAREGRQVLGFCKGPASWLLGRRWEDYPFESKSDRVSGLVAEGAWSEVVDALGVEVRVPWDGDPLWAGDVSGLRERELKAEWWNAWWEREGSKLL